MVGLVLLVVANGLFVRAGTDIIPFRNVSTLVTGGVPLHAQSHVPWAWSLSCSDVPSRWAPPRHCWCRWCLPLSSRRVFIVPEEQMLRSAFPRAIPGLLPAGPALDVTQESPRTGFP